MQTPFFGPFVIWPINSYVTPRIYSLGVSMGIDLLETQFSLTAGIWSEGRFVLFPCPWYLWVGACLLLLSIHHVLMLDVDFLN
jgi:hypothetical protein